MAGKDVSYQFLDALAKSVGMDAETVKQALAEINQLQQQTQALNVAVQGKAPTNHASQQPIFGTADEQMYGHVKIAHEVTNDSMNGVAVSPDAVYAYADPAGTNIVRDPKLLSVRYGSTAYSGNFQVTNTPGLLVASWDSSTINSVKEAYVEFYPFHGTLPYSVIRTMNGFQLRVSVVDEALRLSSFPYVDNFQTHDSVVIIYKE